MSDIDERLRGDARREGPTAFDAALHARTMARVAIARKARPPVRRWPIVAVATFAGVAAGLGIILNSPTPSPYLRPPPAMPPIPWPVASLPTLAPIEAAVAAPSRDVSRFLADQWDVVAGLATPSRT